MPEARRSPSTRIALVSASVILTVAFAAVAVVGVTAATLPGCESCHLDESGFQQATAATSHSQADVTCVSCHVQDDVVGRAKFGAYQAFGMYVPLLDPSATGATAVLDTSCLSCHEQVTSGVVEARGVRIAHEFCAAGSACIDCHSEVGHGEATPWPRIAEMNDCMDCHKARGASLACETCHVGRVEIVRSSRPEFAVTHGPNWQETHGMGEMSSCSACHQEGSCSKCHGPGVPHGNEFLLSHAEMSQLPDATCQSCHDVAFCDSCHLTEMPHPREFVVGHSDIVERDGDTSCMRCHVVADCDTCHVKHVHPGGAVGNIPRPDRGGE